jgi:hypothetical protein
MAHDAMFHLHPAAAAAPLPAARQVQGHARFDCRIGEERTNFDLEHLARGLEDDDGLFVSPFVVVSHGNTVLRVACRDL